MAGSILEIEAQIEMLEAEVSIVKRSGQDNHTFDRLVNAERRLRDALICAEELDRAIQVFHQSLAFQESLNAYHQSLDFFHRSPPPEHAQPHHLQVKDANSVIP